MGTVVDTNFMSDFEVFGEGHGRGYSVFVSKTMFHVIRDGFGGIPCFCF